MLAYFDCFSGISGDMTLGALIDLGVPPRWLQDNLTRNLSIDGFKLEVGSTFRHGIAACSVRVALNDEHGSRTYADIKTLIENSKLSSSVKDKSLAIFKRLAVAESGIHKQPLDRVHFHEVGGGRCNG